MNTVKLFCGAALLAFAASCSQDEVELNKIATSNTISYKVDTDKMSRSTSSFTNGTDVHEITVSAWMRMPSDLPGYGSSNGDNSMYFLNDVLTRLSGSGTFNYETDARYWPANGEALDFFAVVSNPSANPFSFTGVNGKPGLMGSISQEGIDKMPDMLFAHTYGQTRNTTPTYQQNVSFNFNHAFAKVVVTAEVRNSNLRVYITDMEICGVTKSGEFQFPYIVGEGSNLKETEANWIKSADYTTIPNLLKLDYLNNSALAYSPMAVTKGVNNEKAVVLDKNVKEEIWIDVNDTDDEGNVIGSHKELKETKYPNTKLPLISATAPYDLLVIPNNYNGRNASKYQTYIKVKGYAYNIADKKNGWDEECDALIYPKKNGGNVVPAEMIIPIEFDWAMGTINRYNIIFDCSNGGNVGEDPTNPAFIKIGYEVEVKPWTDIDNGDYEYPDKLKH